MLRLVQKGDDNSTALYNTVPFRGQEWQLDFSYLVELGSLDLQVSLQYEDNLINSLHVPLCFHIKPYSIAYTSHGTRETLVHSTEMITHLRLSCNGSYIDVEYGLPERTELFSCNTSIKFEKIKEMYFSIHALPTLGEGHQFIRRFELVKNEIDQATAFEFHKKNIKKNSEAKQKVESSNLEERLLKIDPGDKPMYMTFDLLKEISDVMSKSLSVPELKTLVDELVNHKLSRAERKINKRAQKLSFLKKDLNSLTSNVVNCLNIVSSYVKAEMDKLQKDAVYELEKFNGPVWLSQKLSLFTKERAKDQTYKVQQAGMAIVALVELLLFVAFFLYKRHKTKDFKKID